MKIQTTTTLLKMLILFVLISFSSSIFAQSKCEIDNKYFQVGEELKFDLYFKYGILFTKAGNASLSAKSEQYNGTDAYKFVLNTESSGAAKGFFALSDTLTSYTTKKLVPLAFFKNAHEGDDHTIEKLIYTRKDGKINLRSTRWKNGQDRFDVSSTTENCVYDLLSVVFYARTLDYSTMKKGDKKTVEFISGKRKVHMVIEHQGIESVKANDKNKYSCVKLVLSLANASHVAFDPNAKQEEALKVYITNDDNRMPVRMDFKLKVGSTRGILKNYKGNRHAVKKGD